MRLPSILAAMLLVLLAGVVSVRVLETRMGGATVPGIVVLDAPGLSGAALAAIQARHAGSSLETVAAGHEPLEPFGPELLASLRDRGDLVALYTITPGEAGILAPTHWHKRRSVFPDPLLDSAVEEAGIFLMAQRSTRAFLVAVALDAQQETDGIAPVGTLVAAAADLPSFRRCSVVVLGARRQDDPSQRWSLRIDVGTWVREPEPALGDLLSARW